MTSLISRVLRSTELRVQGVTADPLADVFSRKWRTPPSASSRTGRTPALPDEYAHKLREAQESHHLPPNTRVLFVEVRPSDASAFSEVLKVEGADVGGHHVLRCASPAIPNAIAALLLFIRDQTSRSRTHTSAGPKAIRSCIC